MKVISIFKLQPGMFVQSVTKQTGHIKVKKQGWVKTHKSIRKLMSAGITEVEIDPEKTLSTPPSELVAPTPSVAAIKHNPWQKVHSSEQEMGKAKKLYDEAINLQKKAFADIEAGCEVNITAFKELASGFMDSIFRNQDALACLTQMRQKDAYLLEHSINVSILMGIFAKHLGIERDIIVELTTGALLHDIGKIKVPDEVLNKPGRFTVAEFEIMKKHSLFSKEILEKAGMTGIAIDIAGLHHERLDGKGYPYGMKGNEISQYVRMASIVDVYDALTAERVYKSGMEPIKAFKILKDGCPNSFDSELLTKFIQSIGIHPVGTLVRLSSQKVGLVTESNPETPLKPVVKTFYSAKYSRYTEIKNIDLASKKTADKLESTVKATDYNIDLLRFYKNAILP